jgi:hypothetical protein
MADLVFQNHGSIFVCIPDTDEGKDWIDQNISDDAMPWGRGIVIEHRFVGDIIQGAINDGLEVEEG